MLVLSFLEHWTSLAVDQIGCGEKDALLGHPIMESAIWWPLGKPCAWKSSATGARQVTHEQSKPEGMLAVNRLLHIEGGTGPQLQQVTDLQISNLCICFRTNNDLTLRSSEFYNALSSVQWVPLIPGAKLCCFPFWGYCFFVIFLLQMCMKRLLSSLSQR